MAKKSVTTPEDQLHIVAAILAVGLGPVQPPADKPNSGHSIVTQRYRQFVRMLTRSTEHEEEGAEE
jgi:hypothetical protein